jgi:hypothetical protein
VPVAFGIFKLVISMVVFDDEVRAYTRHVIEYACMTYRPSIDSIGWVGRSKPKVRRLGSAS